MQGKGATNRNFAFAIHSAYLNGSSLFEVLRGSLPRSLHVATVVAERGVSGGCFQSVDDNEGEKERLQLNQPRGVSSVGEIEVIELCELNNS